jgi:hypothetical protein
MKKVLLLLISVFLFTDCVQAQQPPSFKRFGAGVYAGQQVFGKIYASDHLKQISGIAAGLDLRYAFSKQPGGFSLHFQPAYNTFRHFTSEGAQTQVYRETTWRWKAYHLPLLLRYTFSNGRVRPFAEAGPTLRLRKSLTIREAGYICGFAGCGNRDYSYDLQSETKKDPVAIAAAAGVEIDLWKVTIPVSVRWVEGTGIYETKGFSSDGPYYQNLKTRSIQVTAGVSF